MFDAALWLTPEGPRAEAARFGNWAIRSTEERIASYEDERWSPHPREIEDAVGKATGFTCAFRGAEIDCGIIRFAMYFPPPQRGAGESDRTNYHEKIQLGQALSGHKLSPAEQWLAEQILDWRGRQKSEDPDQVAPRWDRWSEWPLEIDGGTFTVLLIPGRYPGHDPGIEVSHEQFTVGWAEVTTTYEERQEAGPSSVIAGKIRQILLDRKMKRLREEGPTEKPAKPNRSRKTKAKEAAPS